MKKSTNFDPNFNVLHLESGSIKFGPSANFNLWLVYINSILWWQINVHYTSVFIIIAQLLSVSKVLYEVLYLKNSIQKTDIFLSFVSFRKLIFFYWQKVYSFEKMRVIRIWASHLVSPYLSILSQFIRKKKINNKLPQRAIFGCFISGSQGIFMNIKYVQ